LEPTTSTWAAQPPDPGKAKTTKDVSKDCRNPLRRLQLLRPVENAAMGKFFKDLAASGALACFEFNPW
jgi:hypothetical protein